MRTKALLCAALVAAGAISAVAQQNVYSLNVVGYVNVTAPPGYSMLANPLKAGVTNGANEILPATDQMRVLTYAGGAYQFYLLDGTTWVDSNGDPANPPQLSPGKGFFYFNPGTAAQTITFVGEVVPAPGTTNSLSLPAGYSLVGSPMPVSGTPTAIGLPVVDQTRLLPFVNGAYQFFLNDAGSWVDANGDPATAPTFGIGQGFFYFNPTTSAVSWQQSLP